MDAELHAATEAAALAARGGGAAPRPVASVDLGKLSTYRSSDARFITAPICLDTAAHRERVELLVTMSPDGVVKGQEDNPQSHPSRFSPVRFKLWRPTDSDASIVSQCVWLMFGAALVDERGDPIDPAPTLEQGHHLASTRWQLVAAALLVLVIAVWMTTQMGAGH